MHEQVREISFIDTTFFLPSPPLINGLVERNMDFDEIPKNYFAIYETIRNSVWFRENFASFACNMLLLQVSEARHFIYWYEI